MFPAHSSNGLCCEIIRSEVTIMIFVASYCRVSTDKDDQTNSFESQRRYFKEYIERQPDWELYEIYADEAVIIGLKTLRLIKCQKHGAF